MIGLDTPLAKMSRWAVVLFTIATSAVISFALQPDRAHQLASYAAWGLLYVGGTYVAIARARALFVVHEIQPRAGDFSIGAVVAGILYLSAMGLTLLATPHGTEQESWLLRIYLLMGNSVADEHHVKAVVFAGLGILGELCWRGVVQPTLTQQIGPMRAWIVTSLLYALAYAPAAVLLGDPKLGANPLVIVGALGGGLVWGYLRLRTDRLGPSMFAHAVFSWALVEFPLWRGF